MKAVSSHVQGQAGLSVTANRRIKKWLVPTPCLLARQSIVDYKSNQSAVSAANYATLYFKAENLQRTGSFKYRGALAKLTTLGRGTPVITASSGNHGLALATAAAVTGHQLRVVLPRTVAEEKHRNIKALGVETILHSTDAGEAELHAQKLAREQGAVYVSPYDDEMVIAGQGTIALELLQQLKSIDTVFVSMGGGGLISGIGAVIAGSVAENSMTLPLATEVVDTIIECSEDEIADGIRSIAWTEKMLVEGSAALAYAAWKKHADASVAKTQVVILCGGNFDREVLEPIISPTTPLD